VSPQHGIILTCIDVSRGEIVNYGRLVGLQALKGNFRSSEHSFDLGERGAKGSRTPDLLHAVQQEQRSGLGLDSVYLDLQCTGVPVSACKPVRVGCPIGCPLVSDQILPTHPAPRHGSSQPPPSAGIALVVIMAIAQTSDHRTSAAHTT
jgi:hypothetical protein